MSQCYTQEIEARRLHKTGEVKFIYNYKTNSGMEARGKNVCEEGQVYVEVTNEMKAALEEDVRNSSGNSINALFCLFGNMLRTETTANHNVVNTFNGMLYIGDLLFMEAVGNTRYDAELNSCLLALRRLLASEFVDYFRVTAEPEQEFMPKFRSPNWKRFGIPNIIIEHIKASSLPITSQIPKKTIKLLFNECEYGFNTYTLHPRVRYWEQAIHVAELSLNYFGRFLSFGTSRENSENSVARFMLRILFPDYTYEGGTNFEIFPQSVALNSLPYVDESLKQRIIAGIHAYKLGVATVTLHSLYAYQERYSYNDAINSCTCEIVVAGRKFYGYGESRKAARNLAARDALCQLFCHFPNNAVRPSITKDRKYC